MDRRFEQKKVAARAREPDPPNIAGYIGAVLAGLTCLVLIAIFGGETLEPVRRYLGLSYFVHEERGVWADCSDPANRSNRFCRRDYTSPIKQPAPSKPAWRRPDDELPFTLHGKEG